MKLLIALGIALLIFGCMQVKPGGNDTNITPGNNTTIPSGYEVKDFCKKDSDCVRLNSCCDCGLGVYVNKYNQQPECLPGQPRCMCPIALSKGLCLDNKCVAAPYNTTSIEMIFRSNKGVCGGEEAPERMDGDGWVFFNGSIGGGSVCRTISAELITSGDGYMLDLTTKAIPGVAACINCQGTIPWTANITGHSGNISVRYDGRTVFPPNFCGWSTNGTCAGDSDCMSGGCSGQVCQSKSEEPAITTCEYRECYSAAQYGVACGCDDGKCQWK